jgi:hypothetical protein
MRAPDSGDVLEADVADDGADRSLPSPYQGLCVDLWLARTNVLIDKFPLSRSQLFDVVVEAWKDLISTRFGRRGLRIGHGIDMPPSALGSLIEKLVAAVLEDVSGSFRGGLSQAIDKDIICEDDPSFSFEIKTSTNNRGVYGNKSQGQTSSKSKKIRVGYHLVINYQIPSPACPDGKFIVRFGWLDNSDWKAQDANSGQSAHVPAHIMDVKLVELGRWNYEFPSDIAK